MNTAIIPFAQGIGFSIPIDRAQSLAQEIIEHGRVIRPYLGITGFDVNKQIAAYYELPTAEGVIIMRVAPDSPADRAGLRQGDIILKIDGEEVDSMEEVTKTIRDKDIGDQIQLEILRNEERRIIETRLGKS